jgi:predicted DNA-binding transcriptional regulator AlpA
MQRATACRYTDMSETTFNENMRRGAIPQPMQMPSGMLLWDREDIDAHLQAFKRVVPDATEGVRNVPYVPRERVRNARQSANRGAKAGIG